MRLSMPDIFSKNMFLLLCMNWMSDKKMLQKSTDIFILPCLLKEKLTFSPSIVVDKSIKTEVVEAPVTTSAAKLDSSIKLPDSEELSSFKSVVDRLQKELQTEKAQKGILLLI